MSYKILEQNGVENEVVDGGALNNFCAGNRDGIIAGVLSECALSAAGNGVAISPGLLIICGVRIKITVSETLYVSSVPLRATRYQIIAQVTLGADGNTSAEFFLQSNASLKRDAIYAQGYGTYQAEIGSFTHNPDGSISDMVRTLDVLYGGGNGSANIEVGNVVTQTLPAGQDAEFDMTARNENGKTIFDVKALIPRGASGTDEEAVHFTPQTLTEAQKTQARANINALSAAEADIQHIAVDCDHEYEITGYTGHEWNVAVPDHCQLTVTRIKGQTGRLSPNLAKCVNVPQTTVNGLTYSVTNGSLTINGTATSQLVLDLTGALDIRGVCSFTVYSINASDIIGVYFQDNADNYSNDIYVNPASPQVKTYTFNSYSRTFIIIPQNTVCNNTIISPMLVKGTYTAETMPAYQPFDDTLVNSKVRYVLSTGKNLVKTISKTVQTETGSVNITALSDGALIIPVNRIQWFFSVAKIDLPAGTYSYYSDLTPYGRTGVVTKPNNVFAPILPTTFTINAPTTIYVNYCSDQDYTSPQNVKFYFMLVYGATVPTEYQPYISDDTFGVDLEITQFGEVDNLTKQFTEYGSANVITLDGSADEGWFRIQTSSADRWRFNCNFTDYNGEGNSNTVNIKSNWIDVNANQTWDNITGIGSTSEGVVLCNPAYSTVEELRAWLAANPIQFIYRLATPRIQKSVNIQAGYSAHKGGLQQQVIEGDYLPYIITKDYPVNGAAQILKNLEIDRDQGKMLDAIQQGALPVGKLANTITIISGDTKKTFDGSTPVEITASGEAGPPGERGEQGVPGEAATITIRNVDVGTALPGQPATVVIKNVGTSTNAILDFGFMIPRGEQGEQGKQGIQGVPGKSSLMLVVIMNPVIGGSSYYGRILLTCPVPSTGIPNNGFENLIPALKYHDYQATGIISLDQSTLNAKRVYGLRKIAHNGNKLYALIDSQTISAVVDGEELTGASVVVFAQL